MRVFGDFIIGDDWMIDPLKHSVKSVNKNPEKLQVLPETIEYSGAKIRPKYYHGPGNKIGVIMCVPLDGKYVLMYGLTPVTAFVEDPLGIGSIFLKKRIVENCTDPERVFVPSMYRVVGKYVLYDGFKKYYAANIEAEHLDYEVNYCDATKGLPRRVLIGRIPAILKYYVLPGGRVGTFLPFGNLLVFVEGRREDIKNLVLTGRVDKNTLMKGVVKQTIVGKIDTGGDMFVGERFVKMNDNIKNMLGDLLSSNEVDKSIKNVFGDLLTRGG